MTPKMPTAASSSAAEGGEEHDSEAIIGECVVAHLLHGAGNGYGRVGVDGVDAAADAGEDGCGRLLSTEGE